MASGKTSRQSKAGNNKKKATDRQNAAERVSAAGGSPRLPASTNQINHGRFSGETPLTGEDRPVNGAGRKRQRPEQPIAKLQPGDRTRANREQLKAARQQSSLKRKQAGAAGKGRVE